MAISKIVYKASPSAIPEVWMDSTPATATAEDIATPKTAMLANGVLTTGTGSGGSGASNFVTGTFIGSNAEKGTAKSITVPYTGNGYPIAGIIYPTVGAFNSASEYYSAVQRYAIAKCTFAKANTTVAPDYADDGAEKNLAFVTSDYKSSSSDPTEYSQNSYSNVEFYMPSIEPADEASVWIWRMHSSTSMTAFIADTYYGFLAGTEYTYQIIYSE